jgi:hypothetical protein
MPILARRSRLRRQSAHSHNFAESIDKDCELRAKTDFLDAILNPIAITWNASAIESHQWGGHTRSILISPPRLRITRFWYEAPEADLIIRIGNHVCRAGVGAIRSSCGFRGALTLPCHASGLDALCDWFNKPWLDFIVGRWAKK